MDGTEVELSIVVPVYNEEENLPELYSRLISAINIIGMNYEVIFVDDGSQDRSANIVKDMHQRDPRVKLIRLCRNYGHQIALTAGLQYAKGQIAITMDADLQHPPDMLPQLIERWRQGFDIVYTVKRRQEQRGLLKELLASGFYRIFSRIADIDLDPNASDYRLLSRRALDVLNSMPEQHRFIRGLVQWMGFRSSRIEYIAPPRYAGSPKYSILRLAGLAWSGISSFSTVPLRASLYVGLCLATLSFLYSLYALYAKFIIGGSPRGFTGLIVAITFLGGVQLIFLGLIGEYLAQVLKEVRHRPLFVVDEVVGL